MMVTSLAPVIGYDVAAGIAKQAFKEGKTIRELDELYEAGFKGKETEVIGKLIDELDEIENETDDLQVNIRQELQALEKQLDPIDVMFLYRVIELLGDIADRAQSVGRRLEILIGR